MCQKKWKRYLICSEDNLQKWDKKVDNEPDIDHLDVGGLWEGLGDTDEQSGQNQQDSKVDRHGGFEEEVFEVVGVVRDNHQDDGGKECGEDSS